MSSYLPLRHSACHGHAGTSGRTETEMHHAAAAAVDNVNVNAATGYMEHFLNIPEICPSPNYRSPRSYYTAAAINSYHQSEACRIEALQQRNHDYRIGFNPNTAQRNPFYSNMAAMRFADSAGCPDVLGQGTCGLAVPRHLGQPRPDSLSPCTKIPGLDQSDPPSFYPWMSIVGMFIFEGHVHWTKR